MLGEVGIDVEHAIVIVAHDAETVVFHLVGHTACSDPLGNVLLGGGIIFEHAGYLEKRNLCAFEDVGDLGYGAGLTMSQPLAGHVGAVGHFVEGFVADRGGGGKIQQNHRDFGTPDNGEDRGRKRVGSNVEKDEINVGAAELMSCSEGFFGCVD